MKMTGPDLITVFNASLGFLSITYIIDGRFWLASLLILFCVVLDGLDGALARHLDVEHELGSLLDFFADIISFCFAPALLVYTIYYEEALGRGWESPQNALATLIPFLVVFLGTLRLVRFVDKRGTEELYRGLPTPGLALLIIHLCYLFGWGDTDLFLPYITLLLVGTLSISLYAPIYYPKIRKKVPIISGAVFLMTVFVGFFLADLSKDLGTSILILTTSILLGYVFISPLIVRVHGEEGW